MSATRKTTKKEQARLTIKPPNIETAEFKIRGSKPLVLNRFANKGDLMDKHRAGSTSTKGKKKTPRDFEKEYEAAKYFNNGKGKKHWLGLPASAFRAAAVSACRLVGFKMTIAKLSLFVEADGLDPDGIPLVKITKGKPRMTVYPVRNKTGVVDLRARPMWDPGWEAIVRLQYDADQFTLGDVANLLMRIGMQVGVGEGRPDSKDSCGMGWGTFTIVK